MTIWFMTFSFFFKQSLSAANFLFWLSLVGRKKNYYEDYPYF